MSLGREMHVSDLEDQKMELLYAVILTALGSFKRAVRKPQRKDVVTIGEIRASFVIAQNN